MVSPGGAERVVYALHQMYPEAPIYTAAYAPSRFPEFASADVRTTWLDRVPLAKKCHQLFSVPRAIAFRGLDLSAYDIVISSCSAESKYVRTGAKTLHLCYCHTPIRYYWSDYDWYLSHFPIRSLQWLVRIIMPFIIGPLRRMDYRYAQGVNTFIANSHNVAARITKYYNRDSTVIYPPIDVDKFTSKSTDGDYFLIVGRQVAYKRLDLAVDAFNQLGLPLKVSGTGEEIERQRPRAGANIEFLGRVPDDKLEALFHGAKAFIFPPEEDFGMTPIEAMANGVPVIAYSKGGALEYVVEGKTGVFFAEQSVAALTMAVRHFEGVKFDAAVIRHHAEQFSTERFKREMSKFVTKEYDKFNRELTRHD